MAHRIPYLVKGRIRGQKKRSASYHLFVLSEGLSWLFPHLFYAFCCLKKTTFLRHTKHFFSFSRGNNKVSTLNPSCLCKDRTQQDPRLVIIFINIIIGQLFWPTPRARRPFLERLHLLFLFFFLTRRKVDVCVLGMFQREKLWNPCKGRKRWWRAPRWEQTLVEQHTHTKKSTHTFLAVQEIECSWQV